MSVNAAGQNLQNQIALGRQTAISRNRSVEIRFYEVPDESSPGQNLFTAYQAWVYDESGANPIPLGKLCLLPRTVRLDAIATSGGGPASYCSSTLIDAAPHQGIQQIAAFGAASYPYRAFRFRSNGTPDLNPNGPANADTWYLAARLASDRPGASTPPKNYYVVQLDPQTGQTKAFRP